MADKITIREKKAVQARISELNTHKQSVTDFGTAVTAQITALSTALTATAGSGADPVPSGVGTTVQGQFDAAATKLGATSTKLQGWLDRQTVIQEEGADKVTGASGSGDFGGVTASGSVDASGSSSPTPTTPTVKPYSTSGGSTGGTSPYPAG